MPKSYILLRPGKKKAYDYGLYTWNVRSLYKYGALKILINILKKYSLYIMAVSYTHLDVYKRQVSITRFCHFTTKAIECGAKNSDRQYQCQCLKSSGNACW